MVSFRSMIESFASEHGILFMPLNNRTHNGKTLYSFGGITIYLHNQLVYAEQGGRWNVMSLEHLAMLGGEERQEGGARGGGVD
jgi:hypothetical protein